MSTAQARVNRNNRNNRNKQSNHINKNKHNKRQPQKTTQLHESLKLSPEEEAILNRQQAFIEDILRINERLELENKKLQLDRENHIKTIKKLRNQCYGKPNAKNKTKHNSRGKHHITSPYTL